MQHLDFYAISASVIPVALLVLAYEGRSFRGGVRAAWVNVAVNGLALSVILLGEFLALLVLQKNVSATTFTNVTLLSTKAALWIWLALGVEAALLIVLALLGPGVATKDVREIKPGEDPPGAEPESVATTVITEVIVEE